MQELIRWDPFRELSDMRSAMDRVFERGLARPWRFLDWDGTNGFFPVDMYETESEVVVTASLPGVKAGDVDISVVGDTLTIKGETADEREEKDQHYYRQERRYGAFQRLLTLPVKVDADKAQASFTDGVLDLRLPKAAEVRPKTIEVKANGSAGSAK